MENNIKKKIILAGTPEFSSLIFEEIINNFNVVAIITQPDRTSGRGLKLIYSDVKILARVKNIKLFQPQKISEIFDDLNILDPDLLLTCAYGQYMPSKILDIFKYTPINIHPSLLPRHRGSSPVQYSILNGDKYFGVTIMKMIKRMDAGDIIFQKSILNTNQNSSELFKEIALLTKSNIVNWINLYLDNNYKSQIQNENDATYSQKINKIDSEIKPSDSVKDSLLKILAFNSSVGTFINYKNKRLKVFEAYKEYKDESITFNLADGPIYITMVQAPGKKKMNSSTFLKGQQNG